MGKSALALAAQEGDVERVKALLARSEILLDEAFDDVFYELADVDKILRCFGEEDGYSPLMFAAKHGHKHIVELLIRAGANSYMTNYEDKTAYDFAIEQNHADIALDLYRAPQTQAEEIFWKLMRARLEEVDDILAWQRSAGLEKSLVVNHLLCTQRPDRYQALLLKCALQVDQQGEPSNALSCYMMTAHDSIIFNEDTDTIDLIRAHLKDFEDDIRLKEYPRMQTISFQGCPSLFSYGYKYGPQEDEEDDLSWSNKKCLFG